LQVSQKNFIFALKIHKEKTEWEKSLNTFGFIFYFFSNEHDPIHVHILNQHF